MPQYFAFRMRNSKKRKRGTADRVAKHNIGVVFEYMGQEPTIAERIQTLVAKILATSPAGHQLCLIGGFRYRLRLNAVETRQRQPHGLCTGAAPYESSSARDTFSQRRSSRLAEMGMAVPSFCANSDTRYSSSIQR